MSIRNKDAICKTCPYWSKMNWKREEPLGECRFNAPRYLLAKNERQNQDWALTKTDDWCKEHPEFWNKIQPMPDLGDVRI